MNIFSRNFDVVTEEDEKVMEEYFHGFDYRGAGYTFLANYIWRTTQCLCWEVIDGYLCMRAQRHSFHASHKGRNL